MHEQDSACYTIYMTQTGIDHQTEAAEALPHELGCFETFAEELVEAGTATTGHYDEVLSDGLTVIGRFHVTMEETRARCACQGPHDAAVED